MNELFFLLGLSLSIPLLLALHSHNRRTNTRPRLAGETIGWQRARVQHQARLRSAQNDLAQLHTLREREHHQLKQTIEQQASNLQAMANLMPAVQQAAQQLELAARTFSSLGATHQAQRCTELCTRLLNQLGLAEAKLSPRAAPATQTVQEAA